MTLYEGGSVESNDEKKHDPSFLFSRNRVSVKYLLNFPFCSPTELLHNFSSLNFEFSSNRRKKRSFLMSTSNSIFDEGVSTNSSTDHLIVSTSNLKS